MLGNRSSKLLGLEAIRFTSALAVLIWHYQHFSFIAYQPTAFVKEHQPFYPILRLFYDYGFYGVQVFWCVSGFIFFEKYSAPIANHLVSGERFFILRFSRLYPLHLATLGVVGLLQLAYYRQNHFYFVNPRNDVSEFFVQLFLASNWDLTGGAGFTGAGFNGPIWSISVEVLIYLLFFVIARLAGPSLAVNIGVLVGCVMAKKLHIDSPPLDCLGFFYSGGLSALALRHIEPTPFHRLIKWLSGGIALFVPILVYGYDLSGPTYIIHFSLMAYLPVALYWAGRKFTIGPRLTRIIEGAGSLTYSSYLIHFPIQLAIALVFSYAHRPIPLYSSGFFILFMAGTLGCSIVVNRHFEMPAQTYLRDKWQALHDSHVDWGVPHWMRLR